MADVLEELFDRGIRWLDVAIALGIDSADKARNATGVQLADECDRHGLRHCAQSLRRFLKTPHEAEEFGRVLVTFELAREAFEIEQLAHGVKADGDDA